VPPATPVMRYIGHDLRYIFRKSPLAGREMPLAGPGLRQNFLLMPQIA
jgi:hypothetical protein